MLFFLLTILPVIAWSLCFDINLIYFIKGRAFAFVLYLSPEWTEPDGGQLCLFESDPKKNHPTKIAKSILPTENTFSLFRVQHNSWHSVSEVLSESKQRLSLNGWFHYPENAITAPIGPAPALEEQFPRISPSMDITVIDPTHYNFFFV